MPGANYFLSQVAAQTPGPLLGSIAPPKLTPPQCLELISTPRIEPYISVIGSRTNAGKDVATVPYRDVTTIPYRDVTTSPHRDVTTIPHRDVTTIPHRDVTTIPHRDVTTIPHRDVTTIPHRDVTMIPHRDVTAIPHRDVTTVPHRDVATVPPKHMTGYGNSRVPKQRYKHSYSPSPPPQSQVGNSLIKAPQLPPTPPGLGTTDLPNVRKQDNPVGELQELCTKMRWVFPTYYIFCDEAQPHERAFCVIVRLYRFREKGEAKSKRAAKREAATRILNRLRSWPADVPLQFNNHCPLSQSSKSNGMELMPFKPSRVHVFPPPSYYINELSMLSQKHNFATVYVKVEEITQAGEIQFMLQLSTSPVVVIKGSGRSLFLAKADAARKALDCLRILCKSYFAPQLWV